jgi:hypothetical protein
MVWQARKYANSNLTKAEIMQKRKKSYTKKFNGFSAKLESSSNTLKRALNNSLSKMRAEDRYWLIVFTRPALPDNKSNKKFERKNWCTKFWVWDSLDEKIVFEDELMMHISNESPMIFRVYSFPKITEIHQEEGLVIIWSPQTDLYIADFKRGVVINTPMNEHKFKVTGDAKVFYSLLDEETLIVKFPKNPIYIYHFGEDASIRGEGFRDKDLPVQPRIAQRFVWDIMVGYDTYHFDPGLTVRVSEDIIALVYENQVFLVQKSKKNKNCYKAIAGFTLCYGFSVKTARLLKFASGDVLEIDHSLGHGNSETVTSEFNLQYRVEV